MSRKVVFFITSLLVFAAALRPAGTREPGSWQPVSLEPVQKFARVSQQGDIDEGKFTKYDGFLSTEYDSAEDLGEPGIDAVPQPLRRHPYGLALSYDESKLYVTFEGNEAEPGSSVGVIDTASRKLVREIAVGRRPLGIARTPSGRNLVVANQYSNYLSVIDTIRDSEIMRIPSFFYNQKIAFVPRLALMLVTNRALDSLEVFTFTEFPLTARFLFRVPLSTDNRPFALAEDPGYGLGGPHQVLVGADPGFSNTGVMAPPSLVRHLTNVNPRDLTVSGNYAYVAEINGLGVSIVDLGAWRQVASIDLNAPALDVLSMGPYVFISTLGRFAQGFDDVHNEIAVVDTRVDPLKLRMRFTSAVNPPYGPDLGPGRAALVPASGRAPYLSAFGVANYLKTFPYSRSTFLTIEDGFPENPDNLPAIVGGALPDQMVAIDRQLVVAYDASDEIETFDVDSGASKATTIVSPRSQAFTNGTQTAFPAVINKRAVTDDGPFLLGNDDPDYFRGRMPQELVFAPLGRKLYVANRLGESIAAFVISADGQPRFEALVDLLRPNAPLFPATVAEAGEDFYTSSRVSLNRDISCLSCHPNVHTDSKMWHVAATAGRALRITLTNRNLRDTPPFYRSGIRRNLETFRGTFRVMSPEGPFGFFEVPAPFDANGDGVINDRDRGRTTSDVNRNRMFVLERTGTSFERTSSAIAAFLEVEPRLLPNPFLSKDRRLSREVPVVDDGDDFVYGDAVHGEQVFNTAGCLNCHPAPVFSKNEPLSLKNGTMVDLNNDGIPDGVVMSLEQTEFDRDPLAWPRFRSELPREGLPFTSIDTDNRLNFANTDNKFVPAALMTIPRSVLSGRLLVSGDEPTCPGCGVTPTSQLMANTRNIDIQSLRGVWDGGPFLQHGRATDLLSVQAVFNDIGRHGDLNVLGVFDPRFPLANRNYVDLAAFLKSIE